MYILLSNTRKNAGLFKKQNKKKNELKVTNLKIKTTTIAEQNPM